MRPNRWLRGGVTALYLASQCAACTSWRLESVAPGDVIARDHPAELRVERVDGQREVLYKPEVDNDSLRGAGSPEARTLDRAVGLDDVRSVATLHLSPGKTIGLSVGVGAVVGIIIALATWQGPLGGCCGQ